MTRTRAYRRHQRQRVMARRARVVRCGLLPIEARSWWHMDERRRQAARLRAEDEE